MCFVLQTSKSKAQSVEDELSTLFPEESDEELLNVSLLLWACIKLLLYACTLMLVAVEF
jgi:hypothetical protein